MNTGVSHGFCCHLTWMVYPDQCLHEVVKQGLNVSALCHGMTSKVDIATHNGSLHYISKRDNQK